MTLDPLYSLPKPQLISVPYYALARSRTYFKDNGDDDDDEIVAFWSDVNIVAAFVPSNLELFSQRMFQDPKCLRQQTKKKKKYKEHESNGES